MSINKKNPDNRTRFQLRQTIKSQQEDIEAFRSTIKKLRKSAFKQRKNNKTVRIAKTYDNLSAIRAIENLFVLSGDRYCRLLKYKNFNYVIRCTKDNYIETYYDKQNKEKIETGENKRYYLSINDILFFQVIKEYITGSQVKDIAEKYKLDRDDLHCKIAQFINLLTASNQLRFLINTQDTTTQQFRQVHIERILNRDVLNKDKAFKLLSLSDGELTPEEIVYCFIFTHTANSDLALQQSGLIDCLIEPKIAYRNLLHIFLKTKYNISEYLCQLKNEKNKNIFLTKDSIQGELIDQIDKLKEILSYKEDDKSTRANLLKAIEMLGKTIGAFVDKVEVQEVNASDALDKLLEMARKEIDMKPVSTYQIENVN